MGLLNTCYGRLTAIITLLIFLLFLLGFNVDRFHPLNKFCLPAVDHEFVDGSRASRRRGLAVTSFDQSKHLVVRVL